MFSPVASSSEAPLRAIRRKENKAMLRWAARLVGMNSADPAVTARQSQSPAGVMLNRVTTPYNKPFMPPFDLEEGTSESSKPAPFDADAELLQQLLKQKQKSNTDISDEETEKFFRLLQTPRAENRLKRFLSKRRKQRRGKRHKEETLVHSPYGVDSIINTVQENSPRVIAESTLPKRSSLKQQGEPSVVKSVQWADDADDAEHVLVTTHVIPFQQDAYTRIMILLLHSRELRFEFVYCEYDSEEKLIVADALDQIPYISADAYFAKQQYKALCHGERELHNKLTMQDHGIQENDILFAVSTGSDVPSVVERAKTLLRIKSLRKAMKLARVSGRSIQPLLSTRVWAKKQKTVTIEDQIDRLLKGKEAEDSEGSSLVSLEDAMNQVMYGGAMSYCTGTEEDDDVEEADEMSLSRPALAKFMKGSRTSLGDDVVSPPPVTTNPFDEAYKSNNPFDDTFIEGSRLPRRSSNPFDEELEMVSGNAPMYAERIESTSQVYTKSSRSLRAREGNVNEQVSAEEALQAREAAFESVGPFSLDDAMEEMLEQILQLKRELDQNGSVDLDQFLEEASQSERSIFSDNSSVCLSIAAKELSMGLEDFEDLDIISISESIRGKGREAEDAGILAIPLTVTAKKGRRTGKDELKGSRNQKEIVLTGLGNEALSQFEEEKIQVFDDEITERMGNRSSISAADFVLTQANPPVPLSKQVSAKAIRTCEYDLPALEESPEDPNWDVKSDTAVYIHCRRVKASQSRLIWSDAVSMCDCHSLDGKSSTPRLPPWAPGVRVLPLPLV